jgi:hypothetical protein
MSTKNNPGKYPCYERAEPDEPMFVLLGRDPIASFLITTWARVRQEMGKDEEQSREAYLTAFVMQKWAESKGKDIAATRKAVAKVLRNTSLL